MTGNDKTSDPKTLACAAFAQGDFSSAEFLFRQLALAAPDSYDAHYNLGVALSKLDRLEEAIACFRKTIELNGSFTDAYINLAFCLSNLNMIAQARQMLALVRQAAPDNAIPVLHEAIAALALGDYAAGWRDYVARWRLPAYAKFKRDFSQPYWNGEDISGKTLFLFAEQGFGDTIQMARFVPILTERGARVVVESPPALKRLLRSLGDSVQIISRGEAIPDFDFHCAMMDIPRALGTVVETIPSATPYLFADEAEIAACRDKHLRKDMRHIGLSWAGRASHRNDHNRSLPFACLAPLLACKDIDWISLQRLVSDKDLLWLEASPVADWGRDSKDFAATAASIMTLDLVITVDTAIAHLAGALGKPVWILLPFCADWRWFIGREDSPWYPTARLFRQSRRGEWGDVIAAVAEALKATAG